MAVRPDSELILAKRLDYQPEVRVFVQQITKDLRATSFVTELRGWESIQIGHSVNGIPTANVVLANIKDRYFNKTRTRTFKSEENEATRRFLDSALSGLSFEQTREINPHRHPAQFAMDSNDPFRARVLNYINTIYEFGTTVDESGPFGQPRENEFRTSIMPRIFIDIIGRDRKVYAGFSGIIAGITDIFQANAEPAVQLTCKGSSRMLELGEILTLAAVNHLEQTVTTMTQEGLTRSDLYKSITFAGLDGTEIIRRTVRNVQVMYCFDAQIDLRLETNKVPVFDETEYFWRERFWDVPTEPFLKGNTRGENTLRKIRPVNALGRNERGVLVGVVDFPGREDGVGIQEGDPVDAMRGRLLVDENILTGAQLQTFQFMITNTFSLFQAQKMMASQIVRKVADTVFYDFFEDPNGNLVFQIPKYNNFPAELSAEELVNVYGSEEVVQQALSPPTELGPEGQVTVTAVDAASRFDYSPAPELLFERNHGRHYMVTNGGGLNKWSLNEVESEITTFVETVASPEIALGGGGGLDPTLTALAATGRTNDDESRRLQRRFGMRSVTTQQMLIGKGYLQPQTRVRILDAFAKATQQILNAQSENASLSLLTRPDLQVGRTVWAVERQKLYYLMSINHNLAQRGSELMSSLSMNFGHDIADRISSPWAAVRQDFAEIQNEEEQRQRSSAEQTTQEIVKRVPPPKRVTRPTTEFSGLLRPSIEPVFGGFQFETVIDENGNARINYLDNFEADNLVFLALPTNLRTVTGGQIRVHKKLKSKFNAVFKKIASKSKLVSFLNNNVRNTGAKGISAIAHQARHTNFKETSPLSTHAWGIAIDIGFGKGWKIGDELDEVKSLVPIFEDQGFYWGGNFKPRDDIHFQYAIPPGLRTTDQFEESTEQNL